MIRSRGINAVLVAHDFLQDGIERERERERERALVRMNIIRVNNMTMDACCVNHHHHAAREFPPQILPPPPGIPTFHNNVMPMAAGAVSTHAICPRNNPSARIDLRIILHAVPQKDTQDEIRSLQLVTYPELGTDL